MHHHVLALIPARGGSKSVPRKNLISLGGKPLIGYSIEHALACPLITRTIVSTDDLEIARVAQAFGAEVPFMRPAEYATDSATDLDVFEHALAWLESNEGYTPDLIVHLRPTGPVRRVSIVTRAVQAMLDDEGADALRSVSLAEQTPYKMWRVEGERMRPLLEIEGVAEPHSMPRQALPRVYWQNGYVDVVRPRTIRVLHSMVGASVLPFVIDDPVFDLDYPEQIPALEQAVLTQRQASHAESPETAPVAVAHTQ